MPYNDKFSSGNSGCKLYMYIYTYAMIHLQKPLLYPSLQFIVCYVMFVMLCYTWYRYCGRSFHYVHQLWISYTRAIAMNIIEERKLILKQLA